jgi:xylulokinase
MTIAATNRENLARAAHRASPPRSSTRPCSCPRRGEYVANGAAVQAAWVLSGERPRWPLELVAEPEPDFRPEIRERYAHYAGAHFFRDVA